MKCPAAVFVLLVALAGGDPMRLSKDYSSLPYRGFSLEKIRNQADGSWGLRLSRPAGDPLDFQISGNSGLPSVPEHVHLGIRNLLGGNSRQLVGRIWTGGAHCCFYYWIIDISSSAQVIFDSRRYDGDELQAIESIEDLNGDGIAELTFRNSLRGWRAAAFAHWPAPVQIFRFDTVRRHYRPANHEFPTRNTRGLATILKRIRAWRPDKDTPWTNDEQQGDVIEAALTLVYAGRSEEAETLIRKYGDMTWQQFLDEVKADRFYQDLVSAPGFQH